MENISRDEVHIIAVDCGIKNNIIRYLVNDLRVKLTVVPWNYDFTKDSFDGLFLSNGPGDPTMCKETIEHVRHMMQSRPMTPIFGICLGNQILGLAAGASTYKMKFGNRGMNQPCIDTRTTRCYITPQNHGYAIDSATLPAGWMPLMINANDGSNEGIIHRVRPWFAVQFHPEACGGPMDTSFLFGQFIRSISSPMSPAVTTIPYAAPRVHRKVLLLGSGGLSIGQAGEFDYSGSQAIKALRECGVRSVVVNPNIASVQTNVDPSQSQEERLADKGAADRVFFLPVTPDYVESVIAKEKPDAILISMGGQTALNCGIELDESGVLAKHNCRVLGTSIETVIATEDREIFKNKCLEIGEPCANSIATNTVEEALAAGDKVGYPLMARAAFALGGLGSGICQNAA